MYPPLDELRAERIHQLLAVRTAADIWPAGVQILHRVGLGAGRQIFGVLFERADAEPLELLLESLVRAAAADRFRLRRALARVELGEQRIARLHHHGTARGGLV